MRFRTAFRHVSSFFTSKANEKIDPLGSPSRWQSLPVSKAEDNSHSTASSCSDDSFHSIPDTPASSSPIEHPGPEDRSFSSNQHSLLGVVASSDTDKVNGPDQEPHIATSQSGGSRKGTSHRDSFTPTKPVPRRQRRRNLDDPGPVSGDQDNDKRALTSTCGIFTKAKGFVIHDSTFVDQSSTNNLFAKPDGLQILYQHTASGAIHDSLERFDAPKCHPETRTAVMEDIMSWIQDESSPTSLLCMLGPAGSGKSAIQQSAAEIFQQAKMLAASFFFSTLAPERNNEKKLIATIAYQIAQSIEEVAPLIMEAVERNPSIFQKSLEVQLTVLLLDPLKRSQWRRHSHNWPYAILIDGLDECNGEGHQAHVIRVIHTAITSNEFPFRIFITSRPEFAIRSALTNFLGGITHQIALDDTYNPHADIALFLRCKLADIYRRSPRYRISSATPWPSDSDIDNLVDKASGQFIYAATVIKYIDDRHYDPIQRLQLVLQWTSGTKGSKNPFEPLDILYTNILMSGHAAIQESSDGDLPIVSMLHKILAINEGFSFGTSPQLAERILFLGEGDIERILSDLHSLVLIPRPESFGLRFHHKSLQDFLLDPLRSKTLHLNQSKIYNEIALCCLKHLNAATKMDIFNQATPSFQTPLTFSIRHWAKYSLESSLNDDLLAQFLQFDFEKLPEKTLPYIVEQLYQRISTECSASPKWRSVGKRMGSRPRIRSEDSVVTGVRV